MKKESIVQLGAYCVCIAVLLLSLESKRRGSEGRTLGGEGHELEDLHRKEEPESSSKKEPHPEPKASSNDIRKEKVPDEPSIPLCDSVRAILASFDVDPIRGETEQRS